MLVYIMLALCVGVLMAMMFRYDIHRREPWHMVAVALTLGATRPSIDWQRKRHTAAVDANNRTRLDCDHGWGRRGTDEGGGCGVAGLRGASF